MDPSGWANTQAKIEPSALHAMLVASGITEQTADLWPERTGASTISGSASGSA
jgi:hypothetical protein